MNLNASIFSAPADGLRGLRDQTAALGRRLARTLVLAAAAAATMASLSIVAPANAQSRYDNAGHNVETIIIHKGKTRVIDLPLAAADVVVSDPNIVDAVMRTARQPMFFGQNIGQANAIFFDSNGRQIVTFEIRVEYDTAMLGDMIEEHFPTADVEAESILGEVILTGQATSSIEAASIGELAKRFVAASKAATAGAGAGGGGGEEGGGGGLGGGGGESGAEADGVVNRINVINEEQVLLRVQVSEVNRTVLKRLGLDWNAGLQSTILSTTFDLNEGEFTFQQASLSQPLDTFFKVLERHNLKVTLAEPSLTAVSGESAAFLAGGEFPIPIASDDDGITIEFKPFGISLDFTPVVIGEGRINLTVATEVSELSDENGITIDNLEIKGLTVSRANTTVEMSSGGTMMMAGLLSKDTRRLSSGLPGLRQLPVLGQLFRSEEFQNDETELVITVTPYTVRQGKPEDIRVPTDGFAPASDIDMFFYGRLYSVYGTGDAKQGGGAPDPALKAPVGFIME
ncbi:MAG: type II and III secretion system protein family protein [Pseudomonadota bacterium]